MRIPDKPTAFDLDAIGHGNPESYDEDRNGVLILDELGTWLNARSFQDKARAGLLDWLIHARKLGWDVYLIVQDAGMIDKQVREALIEYQCRCMRMDKVRIPVLGGLLSMFSKRWGYLPRLHMVAARVGSGQNAIVAERWFYRGDELHACYDTRQVFSSSYDAGAFSALPPWDWQPADGWWAKLRCAMGQVRQMHRPALKPKARIADLLQVLPPDRRIPAARRMIAAGRL